MNKRIYLDWSVGPAASSETNPDKYVNAVVPGSVQLDWAEGNHYPNYQVSDNYKKYSWMEDQYWVYKSEFQIDKINSKVYFISKGIDYEFEIFLNGELLLHQEGMYKYVNIEITDHLKENNELMVKIYPVPKLIDEPANHVQASQSCKPAASYGWDWHPRLIPLGIWDDTYVEIKNATNIQKFTSNYKISDNLNKLFLSFDVFLVGGQGKEYELKLTSPLNKIYEYKGEIINNNFTIHAEINEPELWYPIGYGRQSLYNCELLISDNDKIYDTKTKKIGFRKTELVMNEGAWQEPSSFPKTRSVPPIQLKINGIRIFCKGSNWVMPEIFYGSITGARYQELIDLAVNANFNMLRLWGGSIINKESFYEYCDEKGILVWQEFPLACNNYFDSEKYLTVLENESLAIIKRIKEHPCLAMWSGGNELFNDWSRMTDQSKALRLLNKLCYDNDEDTPFIPTSPLMGMGHGHYLFYDNKIKETVFDIYTQNKFTANTEYGVASPSSLETLRKIIPSDELWPPKPDTAWEDHHAFNAWVGDTWLSMNTIEKYYGKQNNIEELVENGQLLQAVGLKFIYEESRRQKPYCSMALNWCFTDCWPSAANTSIVEYPSKPKTAYYAVKDACRPTLASIRARKFEWQEAEIFKADLFILNDSFEETKPGKLNVYIQCKNIKMQIFEWNYQASKDAENIGGPTLSYKLEGLNSNTFTILLEDENNASINSEYLFIVKK